MDFYITSFINSWLRSLLWFVLRIVHRFFLCDCSFAFFCILSMLRWAYRSLVLLFILCHQGFQNFFIIFFLFVLFFYLLFFLELIDMTELLQVFCLPFFPLFLLLLNDVIVKSFPVLTDGKFFIVVHGYFYFKTHLLIAYLHSIYSYSSWKSFTYRCASASFAVSLWFGLKTRRCFNRSIASSLAPGNIWENVFFLGIFVLEMILAARGESTDSTSFGVGRPVSSKILSIWLRVEVPGNRDFPVINYPRMHPTDHISTAFEYLVEPNKI